MKSNTLVNEERLPIIFDALGDRNRLKIFKLLLKNKNEPDFCVSDIAGKLGTSVPAASRQLKAMEMVGLVRRKRVGQMICYEVIEANPVIKQLIRIIKKVEK